MILIKYRAFPCAFKLIQSLRVIKIHSEFGFRLTTYKEARMKEILKEICHKFFDLLGHVIWILWIALNRVLISLFDAIFNSLRGTRLQDEHMRYILAVGAGVGLFELGIVIARYLGKLP